MSAAIKAGLESPFVRERFAALIWTSSTKALRSLGSGQGNLRSSLERLSTIGPGSEPNSSCHGLHAVPLDWTRRRPRGAAGGDEL